ncbi:MAG: exosortase system-associated protein, TIGR04073 family [Candidatus Omnitrophica bacterium]|nr:exosortase system-associated protein, TIGR04073 family [Candidatus Omnitrophota bacterium]MDD5670765.1 exosortase system-associated protein, TIGR04073 family [Candidatus Omnitrophota bacterium]
MTLARPCGIRKQVCIMTLLAGILLLPGVHDVYATAASAQAVTSVAKTYTWKGKLKRGALNIVSSPVEIARSISIESDKRSLLYGWTVGLLMGFGDGILRFGAGVVDLCTFPFDFPKKDKGPLLNPEYVWEKPGPRYA